MEVMCTIQRNPIVIHKPSIAAATNFGSVPALCNSATGQSKAILSEEKEMRDATESKGDKIKKNKKTYASNNRFTEYIA